MGGSYGYEDGVRLSDGEQTEQDQGQVRRWIGEIESSCFNRIEEDQKRIKCRAPLDQTQVPKNDA